MGADEPNNHVVATVITDTSCHVSHVPRRGEKVRKKNNVYRMRNQPARYQFGQQVYTLATPARDFLNKHFRLSVKINCFIIKNVCFDYNFG